MSTVGMQIIGTLHGVGQARDLLNSSNGPVTTCDSSETWPIEIVRSLRVSIRRGTKGLPIFLEATDVCRSIKTLFNFTPPATDQEIRAASLQFVRKLSGFTSPSPANRVAFD